MKRLHGFSLMEMMIVLTIVAIVAAASAPMVNKKMVRAASEKSPWIFTNGESIAYNLDNPNGIQDNKTARIGSGSDAPNGAHPRLYITTNNDTTPHIMFGRNDNSNLMRLTAGGDNANLWLNNRAVPNEAIATVALGWNSNAPSNRSVAVGMDSDAQSPGSVAMGNRAKARAQVSIAIGDGAQAGFEGGNDANKFATIAIGSEAIARPVRSIAIGRHAEATGNGSIAMGSSGDDAMSNRARAIGQSSIAIGQSAFAQQNNSIALGGIAQATGQASIAINGNAPSNNSISIGWGANAASNNSLAFGYNAKTGSGNVSGNQHGGKQIALGYGANATYYESTALGAGCAASNYRAAAIGSECKANGTSSVALGRAAETAAAANDAIAIGTGAKALHFHSMAIGWNAKTTADNTFVLGDKNTTVVIPGNLIVGEQTFLGVDCSKSALWLKTLYGQGFVGDRHEHDSPMLHFTYNESGNDKPGTVAAPDWVRHTVSDRRLKNVGKEFSSGLDKIKKLEVFNYTFKDDKDKTPRVGVMAQDLQKVFPDAVIKGEDGFLRIRMEDMFYAVINAVKELDSRTSAQEKKIKELEKRIEELEKRL